MRPFSEKGRATWPIPHAVGEQGAHRGIALPATTSRRTGEAAAPIAIHHGMDLLGGGHVGRRDGVVPKLRDAEGSPLDGHGVNGATGIAAPARLANRPDSAPAAPHRSGPRRPQSTPTGPFGPSGILHAMQREGHGIEVALRDDAGGIDKVLVLRTAWATESLSKLRDLARIGFRLA